MEESSVSESKPLLIKESASIWKMIISITVLLVMFTGYTLGLISVQLSEIQSNMFQVNSIKSVIQVVAVAPVILCGGYSLKIPRTHVYLIALAGSTNVTYALAFYFSATFMPVGNLDSLYAAFYILASTGFELYKRTADKKLLVMASIALTGIFMLVQPWNINYDGDVKIKAHSPCYYMDLSLNTSSGIHQQMQFLNTTLPEVSTKTRHEYNLWLGYLFIITAATAATVDGYTVRFLVKDNPVPVVQFWVILFEGIVSFTLNLVWTGVKQEHLFTFPSGTYCILFYCSFIFGATLTRNVSFLVYQHWHVSKLALCNVFVCITLYISQRTYLSEYYPGHANMTEIFGIVTILFGVALLPTVLFVLEQRAGRNSASQ